MHITVYLAYRISRQNFQWIHTDMSNYKLILTKMCEDDRNYLSGGKIAQNYQRQNCVFTYSCWNARYDRCCQIFESDNMHILLSHYIYVLFSDQFTINDPINFIHLLHLDSSWYKPYTKMNNKPNYIFTTHKSVALLRITVP